MTATYWPIPAAPARRVGCRLRAVLVALAVSLPVSAATPREEVLRLVPEDTGFCFIVQDLRRHSRSFAESPLLTQLQKSALGRELANSEGARKLADVEKNSQKYLDLSWQKLRDDFLGDTVIFAYRAVPNGPEKEQGLILLRARDADELTRTIARLNDVQKQSGEIKGVEARKHNGVEYHCRVEANRKQFYYVHGPLLAFTAQEEMLRSVIDRDRQASRALPAMVAQVRRLGLDEALAVLWVNPRAFDAEIERKAATAPGPEALVLQRILAYWKALEGIGLSATVQKNGVEFGISFLAREGELPAAARKFFAANPAPSDLWGRFPDQAILAIAGKVDTLELTDLLSDFIPPDAQRTVREALNHGAGAALGLDVIQDVLPNIGPDWGLSIMTAPAAEKTPWPTMIGALRVRPGGPAKRVDQTLLNGLNSLAVWLVISYNQAHADPMKLASVFQDKVEVKYLSNDKYFPPGVRPAFALKEGYLIVASSPEAVRAFRATPVKPDIPSAEAPLIRCSLRAFRAFLDERLDLIAARVAEQHGISIREATQRLRGLIAVSEFFENWELTRRAAPGQVTLLLRVRTEQSLQK